MSNILREQLADLVEEAIDSVHDIDVTHSQYAWAAADAIVAALPGMVKPLVWEEIKGHHYAGDYVLINFKDGFLVDFKDEAIAMNLSFEAAKAAAQAHHAAQIMQAFGVQGGET